MILITGAAGFIGSFLAGELERECIGIDNFDPFYNVSIKKDNLARVREKRSSFVFYEGDLLDRNFLEDVFRKHDISLVVHLAAKAGGAPLAGRAGRLCEGQRGGDGDFGGNHEKAWCVKNGFRLLLLGLWGRDADPFCGDGSAGFHDQPLRRHQALR